MVIEAISSWYVKNFAYKRFVINKDGIKAPSNPDNNKKYLMYIHIPFCEELCPYCTFNRIYFKEELAREYFKIIEKEILIYKKQGYQFDSVYVGGGTPTVLPAELVRVLQFIKELWSIKQISVETNPNHLTPEILELLNDAGVNRLSVGVQTFNDPLLQSMGRYVKYGSGAQTRERLKSAMGIFDTLNVDIIFNFPDQTLEMLIEDLEILKETGPEQITCYPLMGQDGRDSEDPLGGRRESLKREKLFYRTIVNMLKKDYKPVTVWCFSRKRGSIDEYIVEYDEYAGIGAGSFSYIKGKLYSNTCSVERYIDYLQRGESPVVAGRTLMMSERARYDLLMRLFGKSLDLEIMKEKYGKGYWIYLWKELLLLFLTGAVRKEGSKLLLRPFAYYPMVVLMRDFFTGVNNLREISSSFSS